MSDLHEGRRYTPAFDHQLAEVAATAARTAQPRPASWIRQRSRRATTRRAVAGGVATLAVLAGVGFGLRSYAAGRPPAGVAATGSPSSSPSSPGTPATAPPVIPSTPPVTPSTQRPAPGVPTCTISQLAISLQDGNAGSGHRSKTLVFTNSGGTTCRLRGYPGVAALNRSGVTVADATRRLSGYLGGVAIGTSPPTVDLAAGQSASAVVEGMAVNLSDGSACTPYAALLVTPPDETHSVRFALVNSDMCSTLEIHPVVPGVTGQYNQYN